MKIANVSQCANPQCGEEFKRLGEGKLFVRRADKDDTEPAQKTLWLCSECAVQFDLRFVRRKQEYTLVRHRRVG